MYHVKVKKRRIQANIRFYVIRYQITQILWG